MDLQMEPPAAPLPLDDIALASSSSSSFPPPLLHNKNDAAATNIEQELWPWLLTNIHLFCAFAMQCQELLKEALIATGMAVKAWWKVMILLGRPLLRFLLYLWKLALPYFQWFAQTFFNHLKEQEPQVLLGYALFVGAIIGFFLIRRLLRRLRVWDRCRAFVARKVAVVEYHYHKTTNKLRQYSRRAAEAFPHVLFACFSLGMMWLFPQAMKWAAQEFVFNIILLYLPALATFYTLQHHAHTLTHTATTEELSKAKDKLNSTKQLKDWLSYWIVAAVIVAGTGVLEQLWLKWVTRLVPWGGEVLLFCALWLHLPQGGGALIKEHLSPFLRRNLGGMLALQEKRDAVVKNVMNVLVFARLLRPETAERLTEHVDEIFLVVPAAVLTLSPLAGWGLLFISQLFPAFASVRALGASTKYSPVPWLRYWFVYALSHLFFQLCPFWSAMQMWYYLWVLLPSLDFLPVRLDGRNVIFEFFSRLNSAGAGAGGGGGGGKQQQKKKEKETTPRKGKKEGSGDGGDGGSRGGQTSGEGEGEGGGGERSHTPGKSRALPSSPTSSSSTNSSSYNSTLRRRPAVVVRGGGMGSEE